MSRDVFLFSDMSEDYAEDDFADDDLIVLGDEEEDDDDLFERFPEDDDDEDSDMTVDEDDSDDSSNESEISHENEENNDHMDHDNNDNAEPNQAPPNQPSASQQNHAGANLLNDRLATDSESTATANTSALNISATQMDTENTCVICTEMWTTSDSHHVVALKCGHLFGKSCIENWLAPSRNYNRCPQCNKPAKRRDIYKIYSRCVRPLDTWERDETYAKMKVLEQKNSTLETILKQTQALNKRLISEKETLECTVLSLKQMKSNISATSIDANIKNYMSSRTTMFKVTFFRDFAINEGNCRRQCYSSLTESLAISTTSAKQDNSRFPKFGIKKVPLNTGGRLEMINIHTEPIRDMVINKYDSTIASVSLDKTIKISSFMSKETHLSSTFEVAPWSVHFYENRPNLLFIGLNGGVISVRDKRKFNESVLSLRAPTQTPVYSLSTIEFGEKNSKRTALLSVQPDTCSLFIFSNGIDPSSSDYKMERIPIEGRFASTWFDSKSGLSLLSCRPSPKHEKMTHLVLSFVENTSSNLIPNIVNIFEGGTKSTVFPRSKMYANPLNDENVILCAGDEASNGAIFWDYNASQSRFNTSNITQQPPIVDIEMIHDQHFSSSPIISCLSENVVKLYKLSG